MAPETNNVDPGSQTSGGPQRLSQATWASWQKFTNKFRRVSMNLEFQKMWTSSYDND